MKLFTTALMCLLLAAMWLQDVDGKSMPGPSSSCCFTSLKTKLPLKFIKCYRENHLTCPYFPAVVFRLMKDKESCALTNTTWVQEYLKKVKPC